MKRTRFEGGEGEEGEMESITMANVLMLLSQAGSRGGNDDHSRQQSTSPDRVFECKTCNRQFQSFQALGGHRASHKRPKAGAEGQGTMAKPRTHECSICGLEFAIGQALGGHMRRHRAAVKGGGGCGGGRRPVLCLDLNMPPLEEEEEEESDSKECPKLGFGLEIVDKISMLDCLY